MQPLKQPLLDVKWENYDINVVQQAYIRKFSKLDNIGTPLRLFESFFDDALVDEIVDYTKLQREMTATQGSKMYELVQFNNILAPMALIQNIGFQRGCLFERGAYKESEFLLFMKTFFNIMVRHKNKNAEDK